MKSSIFAAVSLLAVATVAQPHGHAHKHIKKAEPPMVIVTEMVSTTTTVGVTTTIWVTEGQEPASSVAPVSSAKPVVSSASPVASASPSKAQGAQFFEPSNKPSSSAAPVPSSTPTSVAPVVPTTSAAPIPTSTSVETPVSVQSEAPKVQSVAPVVVPSSTVAPVVQAPTTSAAPAPASSSSSGSGSSSSSGSGGAALYGKCGNDSPCTGSTSYYDIDGLTACGNQPDGTSLPVVAMSSLLMGPISNNNPYCGKTITVTYKGASVVATIVDKCPSCGIEGLDLSHAAFKALSSDYVTIGRTDTSWYFN